MRREETKKEKMFDIQKLKKQESVVGEMLKTQNWKSWEMMELKNQKSQNDDLMQRNQTIHTPEQSFFL